MELTTARLRLREQEPGDAEDANVYESDPDSVRFQNFDVMTLDDSREYIRTAIARANEIPRSTYDLAIVPTESGGARMIGRAGLQITNRELKEAMLWYVVSPTMRNRGFATEACARLLRFGFEELGLHRIFADIDPLNVPSRRLCEKLAMRKEAHFVENVFLKNRWCDTAIYAILDREYRAHLAAPLAP